MTEKGGNKPGRRNPANSRIETLEKYTFGWNTEMNATGYECYKSPNSLKTKHNEDLTMYKDVTSALEKKPVNCWKLGSITV